MVWFLSFLFLIILLFLGLGTIIIYRFLFHSCASTELTYQDGLQKKEFTSEFVTQSWEEFSVFSEKTKTSLVGVLKKGSCSSRTIIFCHGVSWTWYGMAKYMKYFDKLGWNLVAFDLRAHGKSSGFLKTYGALEKFELEAVVHWIQKENPHTQIAFLGESMGAAVISQYLSYSRFEGLFFISDSCFSSLKELVYHGVSFLPRFLINIGFFVADAYSFILGRFFISRISPKQAFSQIKMPICLFHGKEDSLAPVKMAFLNFEAILHEKKEIHIFEKAEHAGCFVADSFSYEQKVDSFLEKFLLK